MDTGDRCHFGGLSLTTTTKHDVDLRAEQFGMGTFDGAQLSAQDMDFYNTAKATDAGYTLSSITEDYPTNMACDFGINGSWPHVPHMPIENFAPSSGFDFAPVLDTARYRWRDAQMSQYPFEASDERAYPLLAGNNTSSFPASGTPSLHSRSDTSTMASRTTPSTPVSPITPWTSAESTASSGLTNKSSSSNSSSPNGKDDSDGEHCYAVLLYNCLRQAPDHERSLKDIYNWMEANTSKARDSANKGWQNSVRHNLSMNAVSLSFYFYNTRPIPLLFTFPRTLTIATTSNKNHKVH